MYTAELIEFMMNLIIDEWLIIMRRIIPHNIEDGSSLQNIDYLHAVKVYHYTTTVKNTVPGKAIAAWMSCLDPEGHVHIYAWRDDCCICSSEKAMVYLQCTWLSWHMKVNYPQIVISTLARCEWTQFESLSCNAEQMDLDDWNNQWNTTIACQPCQPIMECLPCTTRNILYFICLHCSLHAIEASNERYH